ncbi:hypothetical protein [Spirosoma areae]
MKSFATYLILVGLFLAGSKLVNRQQEYTRSRRVSSLAESAALAGAFATATGGPAIDTGFVKASGNRLKPLNERKKRERSVVR